MISREITSFIIDRRTKLLSNNSIEFYETRLSQWFDWCKNNGVLTIEDVKPNDIKMFFLYAYEKKGNKKGTIHAYYRALKAFFNWWGKEEEDEFPNWRNPINKVAPPEISREPIPGIKKDEFSRILDTCDRSELGVRDRVIVMFLYDTGVRVSELCAIKWKNVDIKTGAVVIEHGKRDKRRTVFMGNTLQREMMRYIRKRDLVDESYLFINHRGQKLTRRGVETMVYTRAMDAGLDELPSPHDYRRAWFHETRKRADDVTTSRVGGHSDTSLLPIYDYQDTEDLRKAISGSSPLDNLRSQK
jgi:integrase/recombinase XerD